MARHYSLQAIASDHDTVGQFLETEFIGTPIIGDRLSIGLVDLIVVELDEAGRVTKAGIAIDATSSARCGVSGKIANRISSAMRRLRKNMH